MRTSAIATLAVSALATLGIQTAGALTATLDASINVVGVDMNTAGINNAISLLDSPGPITVQMSGNSSFGGNPGEFYNSASIAYIDALGRLQYTSVPNNGSAPLSGSHYLATFMADNAPIGNTGTTTITELNASNVPITSGTIVAGSITPAQTGVVALTNTNSALFLTTPVAQFLQVTVTGSASYDGAGDPFGSIVLQYRDAGNGISYTQVPIGGSLTLFGFRPTAFLAEPAALAGTGAGLVTIDVVPVPEPASLATLAACSLLLLRKRR